jgi:HTH-type transcriptional regulator, sugar sensing transcriptional regulator
MNKGTVEIQETLNKAGFSENESAIFLAILQLGKGTVTQITRKAGLNRTTGYDILDSLVSKGLVSVSGKEPKQEYLAESPDKLVSVLESELHEKERRIAEVKKLVPSLKSIHNVAGRPKVRFYEGVEGLKDVYEDTLTSHEQIRAYANVNEMHEALISYFPKYYERRAEKNISIRAIIPDSQIGKHRASKDNEERRESVLVPVDKYNFSPEINIYDNKMMIASWKEKLGIIIESAEIADAMKKIYELAWLGAKHVQ